LHDGNVGSSPRIAVYEKKDEKDSVSERNGLKRRKITLKM